MANIHTLPLNLYPKGAGSMGVCVPTRLPDKILVGLPHRCSEEKSIAPVGANMGIHIPVGEKG